VCAEPFVIFYTVRSAVVMARDEVPVASW